MLNYEFLKQKSPITITGHKNTDVDSMASCYLLKKLLTFKGIDARILISDGILDPLYDFATYSFDYVTTVSKNEPLFLVDHTENYENEIVGCIDHHPSDLVFDNNFINKSQTSCAKIIADEMISVGMELTKEDIFLIIYSLYMDSLSFKSTKSLLEDKEWAEKQIEKYGFDKNWFYESGLCLNDISTINYDAISYGLKKYNLAGKNIAASYITQKREPVEKESLLIEEVYKNLGEFDYWLFIINCIEDDTTVTYLVNKDLVEIDRYKTILSRGKTLIPMLEKRLSDENVTSKLIEKNLSIATMESCTSGLLASTITDTEGASQILEGSSITYSNKCKVMEGVAESCIENFGVYSSETAAEMASATKLKYRTNISIGVTGSAGRVDPNNADSISGIIYYCICEGNPVCYHGTKMKFFTLFSRREMKEIIVSRILKKLNSII